MQSMKDSFKASVEHIIINLNRCYECDPCFHPIKIVFKDGSVHETEWYDTRNVRIFRDRHFKRYIKGDDDMWDLFLQ